MPPLSAEDIAFINASLLIFNALLFGLHWSWSKELENKAKQVRAEKLLLVTQHQLLIEAEAMDRLRREKRNDT